MLTIFCTPKAFKGHIGIIQRNAIQSWMKLTPTPKILLLGDDPGVAEVAAELRLEHIPEIAVDPHGRPLVGPLFAKALAQSSDSHFCYINCDIILTTDFFQAVNRCMDQTDKRFLMVGQRWNLDVREPIDFQKASWETALMARLKDEGKLFTRGGIDYFVFHRDMFLEHVPPFVIGQFIWDNWLIYRARSLGATVIDATQDLQVIHQNHHYEDVTTGRRFTDDQEILAGLAAKKNIELAGGWDCAFTLDDATHWLVNGSLRRPPWSRRRLFLMAKRTKVLRPRSKPIFAAWAFLKAPLARMKSLL